MDKVILMAQTKLEVIARNPDLLRAYERYGKAASDWTSSINGARWEKRREIARNLKAIGIPVEQIAQGTGLSAGDIAKL
ncbi:MAG: hypothetical protein LBK73_16365 [Treponema sp.]|jgi:hypothetical protein|nr:hypothetical protein [Treponema sp.]